MNGKGSKQRPTDHNRFAEAYDAIFRKKEAEEKLITEDPQSDKVDEDDSKQHRKSFQISRRPERSI